MESILYQTLISPSSEYRGTFYLGGDPPQNPSDPASPDGRARILNQPTRVRVTVMDRRSMVVVAEVVSEPNGTWRVDRLADVPYLVVGQDERGLTNAAVQDWVRPAAMAD